MSKNKNPKKTVIPPRKVETAPVEQAHKDLRNLLLHGRILVNGIPPTAVEITQIIQGEQMMFEKAMKFETQIPKPPSAEVKKEEKKK